MVNSGWCALVNATLLYTSYCPFGTPKSLDYVSSPMRPILGRASQLNQQLRSQPLTTLFDPFSGLLTIDSFPAFYNWLFNSWREQRFDEFLRLHTAPGLITSDSVYLSFTPILNNGNIVGYLPHNDFEPSFKKSDILRLYTNSTKEWDYYSFFVDTKTKFLPSTDSPHRSPRVTLEQSYCNGGLNSLTGPIHSVDDYITFPELNAREYLNLHPKANWLRKLIAAACPAESDCGFLSTEVFTLLFPTDDAFGFLSNEAKAFILKYQPAALSVLLAHVFGSQQPLATSESPFPSYWYIDQLRDAARINGTLYVKLLSGPHDLVGAYDWANGFKFRAIYELPTVTNVADCDFAYAQFPYVDIETTNALLHKVNNVLLPQNVYQNLTRNGISTIYTGCPQVVTRPNYAKITGKDHSTPYGESISAASVSAAAAEEEGGETEHTSDPEDSTPPAATTDTTVQQQPVLTGGNLGSSGTEQTAAAGFTAVALLAAVFAAA